MFKETMGLNLVIRLPVLPTGWVDKKIGKATFLLRTTTIHNFIKKLEISGWICYVRILRQVLSSGIVDTHISNFDLTVILCFHTNSI